MTGLSSRPANLLTVLMAGLISAAATASETGADCIFTNAVIYTVNDEQPWAEAVAVRNNEIIAVGSEDDVLRYARPETRVIDVDGKMMLPGFIDSHVHPIWGGATLLQIDLRDADSVEEVQRRLKAFRERHPDVEYISGGAWQRGNFDTDHLHRHQIDAVVGDIPVILYDDLGHTAWTNSKTLELAGLDKNSEDPEGGQFRRDAQTGELTGIVKELPAFEGIERALPGDKEELRVKHLKVALRYLNENGITSFLNAYMVGDPLGETFVTLYKNSELTARVRLSFRLSGERPMDETLTDILERHAAFAQIDDNFLHSGTVKIFLDGVILNFTAALLQPYKGKYAQYDSSGYLFRDDELRPYAVELDKAGFQLHFHAVGDGATRQALDLIDYLNEVNGERDRRAGISHLTLVSPKDFWRFRQLDIYANAQLLWARRTQAIVDVERYIGLARSPQLLAFGKLQRAGATIVGGSDWPVSTANPFAAMQMAATRPDLTRSARRRPADDARAWLPEQRLTDIERLIRAFTIDGARWQFREHLIGSIEPGKLADLIVIDQNILDVPIAKLSETQVLMTMVDGKIVYER